MLIIKEKSFSERLKEKRKELGLTQDVFASMLDMSPRMYSYYEQGDYDNSDSIRKSKYLLKIAEIEKKEFVFGEPQTQYKKADKPENWNVIYVPIAAQAGS